MSRRESDSGKRRQDQAGTFRRLLVALALGCGLALGSRVASANGRYPTAQQLAVDPSDPNRLWLRATYGLVTSSDAGQTWDWICEPAVGYSALEDPMLAVTADGRVFAASQEGLLASADRGCNWSADSSLGAAPIVDIALESDGSHLLALVSQPADTHYDIVVYRSDDATQNFTALGAPIASDLLAETIDPAPSDPSRIYVTGRRTSLEPLPDDTPAVFLRTRDGGASWERVPIMGTSLSDRAFIAAVDPIDPDVVYVRVQGESKSDGSVIESFLLRTADAGDHWQEIFRGPADMLGFSLNEDGSEVLLGLGDSHDRNGVRAVDPDALGVYRGDAPDFAFEHVSDGQVSCLTRSSSGLFMCSNQAAAAYELGLSTDDGSSATPLLQLGDIRGPLACGDTGLMCSASWSTSCTLLGKCNVNSASAADAGAESIPGDSAKPADTANGCGVAARARAPEPQQAYGASAALLLGAAVARRRKRRTCSTLRPAKT